MSSTSFPANATPTPERDAQLLSVGKQCSHPSCQLVDFLPFKCQHCEDSFCQEHFMVNAHSCPKYDASKHDRVAPNCPLCNEPVAIRIGQDPNARMEEHFSKECSVMLGRTVKKSSPICARGKCGKVLFAPIRCDKCQKQFCPTHRFPSDHACTSASTSLASSQHRPGGIPASSRLLNIDTKAIETKATAASAAIKKSLSAASTAASSSKPTTSVSSSHSNPFSKTDRNSLTELIISSTPSNGKTPEQTTPSITTTVSIPKSPKCQPVARTNSFVPRPIFATA